MGILEEKYTKEYFTGKSPDGKKINYGATQSIDENGSFIIRHQDEEILKKLSFSNHRILFLGFGRGEEIVYSLDHGANFCFGVDFSQPAVDIANELITAKQFSNVNITKSDALQFVKEYSEILPLEESQKFDIVIMLDFIEHIPRTESAELLEYLPKITKDKCVVVINTPCYKYDNDVISYGFDFRNNENCLDTSDINLNTIGMHCNKFTTISLQKHLQDHGFINITEAHFFVKNLFDDIKFDNIDYQRRWSYLIEHEFPIHGNYEDDLIEYPYSDAPLIKKHTFTEGLLSDITIFTTDHYKEVVYKNGDYDLDVMSDIKSSLKSKIDVTFFDIGGFVGINSLLYSKLTSKNSKIIAFEPNPYNKNRMLKNLAANNGFNKKVFVESIGFGEETSKVEMTISSDIDNGPSSTSRMVGAHPKISDNQLPTGFFKENVEITTIDEYTEKNKDKIPDFIKIDVEGAEYLVLKGAVRTLTHHRPILYIELHSEYCALMCCNLLLTLGYVITILQEEEDNRLIIKATYGNLSGNFDQDQLIKYFTLLENMGVLVKIIRQTSSLNENFAATITNYEQQNKIITDKLHDMQNSLSWKITQPLRKIKNILMKH